MPHHPQITVCLLFRTFRLSIHDQDACPNSVPNFQVLKECRAKASKSRDAVGVPLSISINKGNASDWQRAQARYSR